MKKTGIISSRLTTLTLVFCLAFSFPLSTGAQGFQLFGGSLNIFGGLTRLFTQYNPTPAPSPSIFVEDVFSAYTYTGTGAAQSIENGIDLANTAAWSTYKLTTSGHASGRGVTVDSSGNIYVTGQGNDGTAHVLTAKYNSSGVLQWQRKLQESSSTGNAIAVDSGGNVYITGQGDDGSSYILTAKYNSSGAIQWQRKLREGSSSGTGIAVDSGGNVYITGRANDGGVYALTAKYDSSGTLQWQRKLRNSASFGDGGGIATDSSGNVYISTSAHDGSTFYMLTAKYNTSGTLQWQRKLKESTFASRGLSVAVSSGGDVYATGYGNGGGNDYIIIVKYNSSGTIQWQRKIQHGVSVVGRGITLDSSDNVYITGQAHDGATYMLVAKYNSSGTIQWQRKLFDEATSVGYGVALYDDNVYLVGQHRTGGINYFGTTVLKQDGSTNTGTAFATMSSALATDAAGTATDAVGGATDSAGTATDSAGTATDSAGGATASSATQNALSESGLVWMKSRANGSAAHYLQDTVRGVTKYLSSESTASEATSATSLTSFNSDGFTIGSNGNINGNTDSLVSWTFKESPGFFDVVTYTGDGVNGRSISHSLGVAPGMIIIKRTDSTENWRVYHRGANSGTNPEQYVTYLNLTNAQNGPDDGLNNTPPTSEAFQLKAYSNTNQNGATYVAYLFAHDTSDNGIIQAGSFTTDGSGNATVDLGWEPQYLMEKPSSATGDWWVWDTARGYNVVDKQFLKPNSSDAENTGTGYGAPTATGFTAGNHSANTTYIYLAIRKGPMQTPTDGDEVYSNIARTATGAIATISGVGFPPDMVFSRRRTNADNSVESAIWDRLRGPSQWMTTLGTGAEASSVADITSFNMDGITLGAGNASPYAINCCGLSYSTHFFRRTPWVFDVVAYTNNTGGSGNQTINHNLGVVPEIIIAKRRDGSGTWIVNDTSNYLRLNTTDSDLGDPILDTYTDSSFRATTGSISNSESYIFYLFASKPLVSKVGSYTGNGSTQNINASFSTTARFVMIKRTDSTGDWYVWDSARGIVAGNDPHFSMNTTAGDVTTDDSIDPYSLGFTVNQVGATNINVNSATYIYLAFQ